MVNTWLATFSTRLIDFEALANFGTIAPDDMDLINFVETADQAWKIIADFYDLNGKKE